MSSTDRGRTAVQSAFAITAAILVPLPAILAGCGPGAPAADLAIENVTVVDAANGVREGRTVSVSGDRIVSVTGAGAVPDAARVVDGTGLFVIPGLWDMHVHLTYDEALTDAMPALFLRHGVTSVRDTGGLLEELLPVVREMRAEGATAPRVFFAGPLLDGEHVVYDGEGRPALGISNPTPERARANVAALDSAGVDFVKIYEMVTPEVFAALADAARARGLPVDGHVPLSLLASDVAADVTSLEHLRNVELDCAADAEALLARRREIMAGYRGDSGAELRSRLHDLQRLPAIRDEDPERCARVISTMAETSTFQVPTLRLNAFDVRPPFVTPGWEGALERVPSEAREAWRRATEEFRAGPPAPDAIHGRWSLSMVGRMHERGVPIGAGTDTPIAYALPGYSLHSELEMLVRAGLSAREALRSATIRPAEFFGLEGEMGTVEPGRRADLVLLSADPLADISNTRRIVSVVSKGELLTLDELDALLP